MCIRDSGYAVGIPGTKGLKGNVIAAALGAICGNYECGLEVLKCCNDDDVKRALHLVDEGLVTLSPDPVSYTHLDVYKRQPGIPTAYPFL